MGAVLDDAADRAVPPGRVPARRGLRRRRALPRAEGRGRGDHRRLLADRAAHDLHDERAGAGQQRRVPRRPGRASGASTRERRPGPCVNKIGHAMHDLDPTFESFSYTRRAGRRRRRHRTGRRAGTAEHVHLQGAVRRRRGRLPPGRDVPVHRPGHGHRVLVRHRGRDAGQRLPVGHAGRPPHVAAQAVPPRRGDATDDGTTFDELDPSPLPDPST